jgi:myo-inositol-1(or 4)-monophosphatase
MSTTSSQPEVFYPLLALPILEGAVRAAGAAVRRNFKRARTLPPQEALALSNQISESIVARNLRAAYPGSRMVSEQGLQLPVTPKHDNLTWWIDALDGEFNFLHGVPRFSVSAACTNEAGEILLGVVYDPIADECFTAVKENGAMLNGEPIQVSRTDLLRDAMAASGFPTGVENTTNLREWNAVAPQVQGIVSMESTALDLCYVAAGRFDVFWEADLDTWDVAAAILIITEAGGRVSTYQGAELDLKAPTHVLATNRTLHTEAVKILSA